MSSIFISAGEASGDAHAAALVAQAKKMAPDVEIFGMGGAGLQREGVDIIQPIDDLAVMGFVEVVMNYRTIKQAFNLVLDECKARRPDVAVLVDYPAYHLKLAEELRKEGIPVVLYIAPQVWAWKPKRKYQVAKLASKLLVLFDFEVDVFKEAGTDVEFVGNPLLDEIDYDKPPGNARKTLGIDDKTPLIALLPGSRRQVRSRLLPIFMEAAEIILQSRPETAVAIGTPDGQLGDWGDDLDVPFPAIKTHDLLRDATAGMYNSGTMSLEAAVLGCPGFIGYKMSWVNYQLASRLVKLPHFGLPNIVLGGLKEPMDKPAMRELIQKELTPNTAAVEIMSYITDTARRNEAVARLNEVRDKLGSKGASKRAAEAVLKFVK